MKKFKDKVSGTKPPWNETITKEVASRFTEINADIDLVHKTVTETNEKTRGVAGQGIRTPQHWQGRPMGSMKIRCFLLGVPP